MCRETVAINLTQLYEDVTLSTVKTRPPSGGIQSGQNVDPFVDDEVLNGYDDSMLDVDMEDNFIPSSKTLDAEKIDRGVNNGIAPPIFKLAGQNYYSIGSLLPSDSLRPTFAQLYIYDTENEIENRIDTLRSNEVINERDKKSVAILRNMLDKYNILAKSFRYARDMYQQKNCTNIKLNLISKMTTDGRTYNLPSASEVAALIIGNVEQLSKDRDIIIESQSRKLQRIDVFHPSYLALQYLLLFLYGEDIFHLGIATSDSISFLVDVYTVVESERLKFFRCIQPQLRVDKYKCLYESLINGDVDVARLGKRIILPSTFTGGPREVTSIGLKAEDRLDILCRVFKIKLDSFIDDLKEEKNFRKILGYVCTVEFQKRGLLHAHILLFMSNEFKPQTPDDIDKHITAEIPYENERPNLHGAVQNYMVHGPCVKKRECVLDNKFIVSYNPKLLLKFGFHINVEYICQTSSIKYLFKYVHKGNDRVTATLYNAGDPSEATQVVDEIMNYYDCTYISACEAVWRLFGYEIQEKEQFVIRLPFHLEDEQTVVYGETSNVNDIVERAISHKSMFLGWMAANMSYPYARSLTYAEFPTKFIWKDDSSKWFPRKKDFAI
ncbi:uncharacterized protein LOC130934798 [Arachis stenosperma]|uniref:uncharacterized protein LOC130934798 n=1 Tax=Arachis stenosperma TaxID=217475 RepID=UPI0025ACA5DB|nr:uncharacterized protein LOC130934798 [Arachis stenosperma]